MAVAAVCQTLCIEFKKRGRNHPTEKKTQIRGKCYVTAKIQGSTCSGYHKTLDVKSQKSRKKWREMERNGGEKRPRRFQLGALLIGRVENRMRIEWESNESRVRFE